MENIFSNQKFNVGIYIRLSREDGDKLESESVSNQRDLLKRYVDDNGYNFTNEYIDDGYSGTSFDRPSFNQMIEDTKSKKINMIITKDLSRLGRDYIQTGYYIEKYFPENRIRYISVLDRVDTYLDSTDNDITPFKSVMNDMYAKDISKKIKSVANTKKRAGQFIGAYATFGYKLDPNNKGKFLKVESQASLVKRIFQMYLEGTGTHQIAKILTKENIQTPGIQMKLKHIKKENSTWQGKTIVRILVNEAYIGRCVQNKTKKINYKSKKLIPNDPSNYIIFENHHEPIIDNKTFSTVGQIVLNSAKQKVKLEDVLLKGFLYCSHCHKKLTITKTNDKYKDKVKTRVYTNCSTYVKSFKKNNTDKCYSQCNEYYTFESKIIKKIKEICTQYISSKRFNKKDAVKKIKEIENNITYYEGQLKNIVNDIQTVDKKISMLYQDRLNRIIREEDYINFSKNLLIEREQFEETKKNIDTNLEKCKQSDDGNISKQVKKILKEFIMKETINKEDLYKLIEKIEVSKDKHVWIYFKFNNISNMKGVLLDDI